MNTEHNNITTQQHGVLTHSNERGRPKDRGVFRFVSTFNFKLSTFNSSRGFTLVETLVSLSIFVFAVVGLITITAQGVNNTNYAKSKITAVALSQEGIEIVRNVRDSYLLADGVTGWTNFTSYMNGLGCMDGDVCNINPTFTDPQDLSANNGVVDCSPEESCRLTHDISGNGYYDLNQSTDSPYIRLITINTDSTSPDSIEVVSTVKWNQGTSEKVIVSREYLMNWFENTTPTP